MLLVSRFAVFLVNMWFLYLSWQLCVHLKLHFEINFNQDSEKAGDGKQEEENLDELEAINVEDLEAEMLAQSENADSAAGEGGAAAEGKDAGQSAVVLCVAIFFFNCPIFYPTV